MNAVQRLILQKKNRHKYLGAANQNKSVQHIIRQFTATPNTRMSVIRDHLYLTFGPYVRVNTDMHELTAEVDSVTLVVRRKENQVEVQVDGELVATITS